MDKECLIYEYCEMLLKIEKNRKNLKKLLKKEKQEHHHQQYALKDLSVRVVDKKKEKRNR